MGIALLCAAPIFAAKTDRAIKWLFIANGIIGIGFLIGNALGIFMVNILASFNGAPFSNSGNSVSQKIQKIACIIG